MATRRQILTTSSALILPLALSGCGFQTAGTLALSLRDNIRKSTEMTVQDNRLYLIGPLNLRTFGQVRKMFEAHPQIDTVVFTLMPGSIDEVNTFALGRWLRKRGIRTHLLSNSVIASGAVDLFLSGVVRTAERGAMLGVHAWADARKQATDYPPGHKAHRLNTSYIQTVLGRDDFYWFTINAAPHDDLHWMSDDEIASFGLLTNDWLEPSADPTPFAGEDFNYFRRSIIADPTQRGDGLNQL